MRALRGDRAPVIAAGACAVVALVTIGVIRGRDASGDGPAKGTRLVYSMDTSGVGDRAAALRRAVAVVRDRVEENGMPTAVFTSGDGLILEVSDIGDERLAQIEDVVARTAKLELVIVDDGSEAMARLAAAVEGSDPGGDHGVTVEHESWPSATGQDHHDLYLRAVDREEEVSEAEAHAIGCSVDSRRCVVAGHVAIQRAVDAVTGGQIGAWLPPDRVLAYQRVEVAPAEHPWWRSYVLDRSRRVNGSAVADASTAFDPQTGRPEVRIQLNPGGAAAFGALTRNNVGRKLAIVLDGKVKSAAVLEGAITGGELRVTMGGAKPRDQELEAVDLVAVVRAGSLPAPLVLEMKQPFDHGGGGFLRRAWLFFAGALVLAALTLVYLARSRVSASRS